MDLRTVTNKVSGKDYAKALRLRRWAFLVILAIGLVWLGCNVWLVPHYDLNDYVRSFYLGGALGMPASAPVIGRSNLRIFTSSGTGQSTQSGTAGSRDP